MTAPVSPVPDVPPEAMSLRALIREDYQTHHHDWTLPGFRTLAVYRFGVWRMGVRFWPLRAFFHIAYQVMFRHCRNVYGIELPYTARVGRKVMIEHQGGIVIHGNTVIGDHTRIRQGCTIGVRRVDRANEAPVIGRNVDIGAGAALLGAIHVGDNASVGANAVVLHDVPAHALVVGIPARVVDKASRVTHAE